MENILTIFAILIPYIPILIPIFAYFIGGILSKKYPKTGSSSYDTLQYGNILLLIALSVLLVISVLLPNQDYQQTVNLATIFGLIFALVGIASGIFQDLNEHQKRAVLDANISDIQKNTQLVLNRVTLMEKTLNDLKQQNQYQQVKSSVPETSESHDTGDAVISAN